MSKEDIKLDITEKGRKKDGTTISLNRRLFVQFQAFGDCRDTRLLIEKLEKEDITAALYLDFNDPDGVGLIVMDENPDFFVSTLREILNCPPFIDLATKPEYTMLGRTYSFGYEPDLEETLINEPMRRILDKEWPWAVWYPLQRAKSFETLPEEEQRAILGEHGKIGFRYGKAGYARDIRLACFGLDKNDNDFVIGLLGRELYPLSSVVQAMRRTKQTSMYLERLGPFFIGKAIWQSSV